MPESEETRKKELNKLRNHVIYLAVLGLILSLFLIFTSKSYLDKSLNQDYNISRSSVDINLATQQWNMVIYVGVLSVVFPLFGILAAIITSESLNLIYGLLCTILWAINLVLTITLYEWYLSSVFIFLVDSIYAFWLYGYIRHIRKMALPSRNMDYENIPGQDYPILINVSSQQTNTDNDIVYPIDQTYKYALSYHNDQVHTSVEINCSTNGHQIVRPPPYY